MMRFCKNTQLSQVIGNITMGTCKCMSCDAVHDMNSETYIGVYGNIMVGKGGGLIGNNLDENGKVVNVSIWCRKKACFRDMVSSIDPDGLLK